MSDVEIVRVRIAVDVDTANRSLSGCTVAQIRRTPEGADADQTELWPEIFFDIGDYGVYHISVNDIAVNDFHYGDYESEILDETTPDKDRAFLFQKHVESEPLPRIQLSVPSQLQRATELTVRLDFAYEPEQGCAQLTDREAGCIGTAVRFVAASPSVVAHAYTDNRDLPWFPYPYFYYDHIDEPLDLDLEITCGEDEVAVSTGDVQETLLMGDSQTKLFVYSFARPVRPNTVGFAVGPFAVLPSPPHLTSFVTPALIPEVIHSTSFLPKAINFVHELLESAKTISHFRLCFVFGHSSSVSPFTAYPGLVIVDAAVLHSSRVLDVQFATRRTLIAAFVAQWFGGLIPTKSKRDEWIAVGLQQFIATLYARDMYGDNELRFHYHNTTRELTAEDADALCPPLWDQCALNYAQFARRKSMTVMRMILLRIGDTAMRKVFVELRKTCTYLTTGSFMKIVETQGDVELTAFARQWVYGGGGCFFKSKGIFSKRNNAVELDVRQATTSASIMERVDRDTKEIECREDGKFEGDITVRVMENDGQSHDHSIRIGKQRVKIDVVMKSRTRYRRKFKELPLTTGEVFLVEMFPDELEDSAILFFQLDPERAWMREVHMSQDSLQWGYQLMLSRDVSTQIDATIALSTMATGMAMIELKNSLKDFHRFWRVRCYSAAAIVNIYTKTKEIKVLEMLLPIVQELFVAYKSDPPVAAPNAFQRDIQLYWMRQAMPYALAAARDGARLCPQPVIEFLFFLLEGNDNSENDYSDSHLVSWLIRAFSNACAITPDTTLPLYTHPRFADPVDNIYNPFTPEQLFSLNDHVVRLLNNDRILPSHRYVITTACLELTRALQLCNAIPSDLSFFAEYLRLHDSVDVRKCAANILMREALRTLSASAADDALPETMEQIDQRESLLNTLVTLIADPFEPLELREFIAGLINANANALKRNMRLKDTLWRLVLGPATAFYPSLRWCLAQAVYTVIGDRLNAAKPSEDLLADDENRTYFDGAASQPVVHNPQMVTLKFSRLLFENAQTLIEEQKRAEAAKVDEARRVIAEQKRLIAQQKKRERSLAAAAAARNAPRSRPAASASRARARPRASASRKNPMYDDDDDDYFEESRAPVAPRARPSRLRTTPAQRKKNMDTGDDDDDDEDYHPQF